MKTKTQIFVQGAKLALVQETIFTNDGQHIIKSTAMKKIAKIFQKTAAAAIAMIFITTVAVAGDATINGTMNNTGTFIVKGALAGNLKNYNGTVKFAKNGDQTVPADYSFEKLECTTNGSKTFAGTVTVSDYIKADAAAVKVSSYKLKITSGNVNAVQVANAGSVDFTAGEVEYARNGIQTIYGTIYKNLTTSGAGGAVTKSAGGDVTVSGLLTNGGNTLLDFGNYSFNASGAAFVNSSTIKSSGAVTVDAAATINGTFEYAGDAQAVAPAYYTNLTLSGGTHMLSGTTKVAGVYAVYGGARTYAGTFEYNGTDPNQSIANENNYANLVLSGGNSKRLAGNISVRGDLVLMANTPLNMASKNLWLTGNLVLGSNITTGAGVLSMTSTIATNVTGNYEVIGAVNRNHSFASNTAYAFNRSAVTLAVASSASLDVTLTNNTSMSPSAGIGLGSKYIYRQYKIAGANFSANAGTLKLYYTDAERIGTFNENKLVFKKYTAGTWSSLATRTYTRNVSSNPNDITLAGLTDNFLSETELGMIVSGYVTVASGSWNIAGTWDGGDIPTATDDAEIRHAVTMGSADHTIANLTIVNDASYVGAMTVDSNTLTAASVMNYGTFSVNDGAAANLSGDFTNKTGAQLNTNGTGALTITRANLVNTGAIMNAGRISVR